MKIIYVAGPYNSTRAGYDRHHGIELNIMEASRVAAECWMRGWAVICPQKNTAGFHNIGVPEETFMRGCLTMVEKCNAILMMDGWEESPGANAERALAQARKIPVFYAKDGLPFPEEVGGT